MQFKLVNQALTRVISLGPGRVHYSGVCCIFFWFSSWSNIGLVSLNTSCIFGCMHAVGHVHVISRAVCGMWGLHAWLYLPRVLFHGCMHCLCGRLLML
uniref:Uncharacterized protein n=1 Tax=Triticum urartu TaxID=4572 RepID=A0A8R7V8Y1_TRIUA